jgi:hypothetical protein
MAIPRFAGYGYEKAATGARHQASLGQFAGMDLPYLGVYGGSVGGHTNFGGVTGYTGPARSVTRTDTVQGRSLGGRPWLDLPNFGVPHQAHIAPVDALRYQGQPTGFGVPGTVPPSQETLNRGRNARSALWQQAQNRLRGQPEAESMPAPDEQLALGPGGPIRSIGAATTARPMPGPPPQPLSGPPAAAGALGPATARPGYPAPTARPMGPVIETTAQQVMPWDVPQAPGGTIASTRAPRSRVGAFNGLNPNQGSLF